MAKKIIKKNFSIILQARQGSTRYPNKVLEKINGVPLIIFLLKRLSRCKKIDNIITAIPKNNGNISLKKFYKKINFNILKVQKKMCLSDFIIVRKNSI